MGDDHSLMIKYISEDMYQRVGEKGKCPPTKS